jgi:hypothetical protein
VKSCENTQHTKRIGVCLLNEIFSSITCICQQANQTIKRTYGVFAQEQKALAKKGASVEHAHRYNVVFGLFNTKS